MPPLDNDYGVGGVEIESAFQAQSNQSLNGRWTADACKRQVSMVTCCNGEKTRIGLLENKTEELRATRRHHQYQCAGMSCWQWHRTVLELESVGLQFKPYWWHPCGVTWDSSQTVVVINCC